MNSRTKDFKATGLGMPSVIPYSDAPAKSAGKKMASDTRSWKKLGPNGVAPDAQAKKVTEPLLPMLPKNGTKSHPGIYARTEPAPKTYGPGSALIGAPKSGESGTSGSGLRGSSMGSDPGGKMPTKWHKKGYDLNAPSDLSGAPRLKKKWSKA